MKMLFAALLTCLAIIASPAMALDPPRVDGADQSGAKRMLSRDEAARRAQKQAGGGRVLGIKLQNQNAAKPYFDVKLLDGGKVRVLRIDAQ